MTELQIPKNYAPVLIRAQFHLKKALRWARLQRDESYSYTARYDFYKKKLFAMGRARSLFAVAKRCRKGKQSWQN